MTDTPDKLYMKYISITAVLPEYASLWSVTLCSVYFSSLTIHLKDKIEEWSFVMPPLSDMKKICEFCVLR